MNASIMRSYNFMLITYDICTGLPSAPAPAPATSKVAGGMKLGKAKKTNQFLESLKAEGELISEDAQPTGIQSGPSSIPPSDPIAVAIEEKINVTVKKDGGIHNFDIQGTLALQVLNDTGGFIQLQVIFYTYFLDLLFAEALFLFLLNCTI
jgi:coatomer subunit delta